MRRADKSKVIANVDTAINLVTIIVSVVLVLVILMQTKGSSFSGAFGGDTSGIYRTRRGVEKILFQFTIGIAVLFLVLAIISSFALS
ncbi:MAG: preprotein translocase subunit SecG [Chloroflexota bacterium]|nr:preprotein translocase subunit SecG [Chloroflexota bacterium]